MMKSNLGADFSLGYIIQIIVFKTYGTFSLLNGALGYVFTPYFRQQLKNEKVIIKLICMTATGFLAYVIISIPLFFICSKGPIFVTSTVQNMKEFNFIQFIDHNFYALACFSIVLTMISSIIVNYTYSKSQKRLRERKAREKILNIDILNK